MTRISTWVTLFFIPIFPYSVKRLYMCPVCQSTFDIEADLFEEMRPIAEANQKLFDGVISESEHQRLLFENRKKIE